MTTSLRPTPALRRFDHTLDEQVSRCLAGDLADRVAGGDLDPDTDVAILSAIGASALRAHLPGAVLQEVQAFAGSHGHVLVLRNLPTSALPPTPVTGFCDERRLAMSNAVQLGLIRLMDLAPFAVGYENRGRLLRNVVPNPEVSIGASSWGASSEFFWHTDNPQLPFGGTGLDPRPHIPHFLSLMGMRNAEQVPTELVALDAVLARLDPGAVEVLLRQEFVVGAPASNDDDGRRELRPASILAEHDGRFVSRFDRDTALPLTPEATGALQAWHEALQASPAWAPVVGRGDLVVFDNYRCLHRRRGFTPEPDHAARWLRRCYAS